jgi:hypothetical protein
MAADAANPGSRVFPTEKEYSAKQGYTDSWLCLHDLTIHENIIHKTTRVGVSTAREEDGFYKKEWRVMPEHCFAFIAEIKDGDGGKGGKQAFSFEPQTVYLGQKKSAFLAECIPMEHAPDLLPLKERMKPQAAIALSDIYVKDSVRHLYANCAFVCAGIREYRSFTTVYGDGLHRGRFQKGGELIRLIKAGSMFLVQQPSARKAFRELTDNPHAQVAGFNHIILGKEWET